MHFSTALLALTAVAVISKAAVPASHTVHEKRHVVPNKWTKRDRIEAGELLPMRIGLKQNNLHKGFDLLMDV